jgi:hypothetical protein
VAITGKVALIYQNDKYILIDFKQGITSTLYAYEDGTETSETSALKAQTPGDYSKKHTR